MAIKKTKAYSEAFRKQAVGLADQPDRTAADVARELGIHPGQIYKWRTQFNKLSKGQFTVADGTNHAITKKRFASLRKRLQALRKSVIS